MQAVLHCPCSNVSQFNLSVYSLGNADVSCFIWNKTECNRGWNKIDSSLLLYLRLPSTTTAALLHGDLTMNNIRTTDQKYLEPGHTEMECGSMHAVVEAAKKCSVYT